MARAKRQGSAPRASSSRGAPASTTAGTEAPGSLAAEVSVLGAMLLNNEVMDVIVPILQPDSFSSFANSKIYEAALRLHAAQRAIDLTTLRDELERDGALTNVGGVEFLSSLLDAVPAASNAEHYAEIVREKAVLRDLLTAAREIIDSASTRTAESRSLLDEAQAKLFQIAERGTRSHAVPIKDILKDTFARIDRDKTREGMLTGLATGFPDLDELTSGLQDGELTIVAGRPSMGKTSLALNIVEHVGIGRHEPVIVFSLEMSREQVARNMLCTHARLDSHRLRRGRLTAKELEQLPLHVGALSEAPIFIDDTPGLNSFELRAKVRRLKAQHGLRLIIVDYLQLMECPNIDSREQQISSISRSLKGIAREMSVPVIAVAQLNRQVETRDDHRPRMADLRESGSLEQDADVVMLVHRESYYNKEATDDCSAELIIAKQRNGPTGTVRLSFLKQFTRFESSTQGIREYE